MKKVPLFIVMMFCHFYILAQVGIGTTNPDTSSILDIESTNQGVLVPRLTTVQRNAISNPANGLLIYNVNINKFQFNSGNHIAPIWSSVATNPVVSTVAGNLISTGTDSGAYLATPVYMGKFIITGTGNQTILGLPFQPSQIKFTAYANVESYNLNADNGVGNNNNTYQNAMDFYGCDRPNLRFGLKLQDITDIVKDTTFQVFSKHIGKGGIVKCIKVSAEEQSNKRLSKGQIEKLTATAQQHGLGGLAYIIVNENDLQSPIIKFLGEDIVAGIIKATHAQVGDIVFFLAADYATVNKALDAVRQELGHMLHLINPKELRPAWVIDFQMFEKTNEGRWTFTHNPFSMPAVYDIEKHINGKEEEIGSIIAHNTI